MAEATVCSIRLWGDPKSRDCIYADSPFEPKDSPKPSLITASCVRNTCYSINKKAYRFIVLW